MNEEISRILKMVEEGKINAEQGSQLIQALSSDSSKAQMAEEKMEGSNLSDFDKESFLKNDFKAAPGEKFLQVRVLSAEGDKVKINLPINFVKGILKVTGKLPMIQADQLEGIDVPELMETIAVAIDNDLTGRLVDVESVKGDLVIVEIV